ncbi:MAG: CbiX/SirB N-terminal domain-containing protein [Opitutaceae bacterium]
MILALIDNGSLEPAATRNLRAVAAALSTEVDAPVHPVSWKHSDRISPALLNRDKPGTTLAPFVRAQLDSGERHFIFVPFFISAQGAIGSALRSDLDKLQREHAATPFEFTFTAGLADAGVIPGIVADRVRETIAASVLPRPPVIVVDHGGPSPTSAALRNTLAAEIRSLLGNEIASLAAASMEGEAHAHNHPLLSQQLQASGFDTGNVVVAPLFLSPGRHAGAEGDIAQICRQAEAANLSGRCHLTGLVGTHPLAITSLAAALRATLSHLHAPLSA